MSSSRIERINVGRGGCFNPVRPVSEGITQMGIINETTENRNSVVTLQDIQDAQDAADAADAQVAAAWERVEKCHLPCSRHRSRSRPTADHR